MAASWNPVAPSGGEMARRPSMVSGERCLVRDDIAGLLAHDLKTPLAAISMNIDFAMGEMPADAAESVRSALEDCRQSNARAVRIVSDMADVVRLATGDKRPRFAMVDVRDVIATAVRRIAPEAAARGVRLIWTSDDTAARADRDLLERALDRLVEHGLRHARTDGAVDVGVRDRIVVIRVRNVGESKDQHVPESASRALATYFADAAMRAQGGAVWTEAPGDGTLLFCLALP